jgi:hypothetical protein
MSAISSIRPSEHLLIPFAACSAESWLPAMQAQPPESFQHLTELLRGMKRVHIDEADAHTLSPPHERALARAEGLVVEGVPDGLIPWAAGDRPERLQARDNKAWAWVTLCHWAMGREHAILTDPAALALTENESRALLMAMQPYFETDGIRLHYLTPERWLAEGELFRDLPTASLDRVLGRSVDAWLPGAGAAEGKTNPPLASATSFEGGARTMRRLQNEMQMLLYTHPLNDARADLRQLPVNSFWLSGTGALSQSRSQREREPVRVPRTLAQPVFSDDWTAYAQAWEALDTAEVAQLLARQRRGEFVRLTLCGERSAHTFETIQRGFFARISSRLSPVRALDLLQQL